ncbi:sensor histidine kinase [Actinokineospora inagensis]|uniref:sensor histidine kinase n=1 Tax=Actinokineospora inagensis TaxID=103730 RepID=UPI000429526F|nr:HAMP domain-containing sensor histidine kinase [Actinokineospora inagensis]
MRRRIVGLALAAAVLAITLFGLPLAAGVAKYNLHDERAELERIAARAALAVATDPRAQVGSELHVGEPTTSIAVYAPTGQLRYGTGPSTADKAVRRASGGDVADDTTTAEVVVAVPVQAPDGSLTAVVRASTPLSEVTLRTGLMWLAMVGLGVLALVLTWLIARRMARRLARPLEELTGAAQVLGDGDFTVRTARTGIAEIDSVGASLDSTARRLGETLDRERAFSAHASHQLRTPLAGLRLQLESALVSPDADPHAAIRAGIESADRLERIVEDLLALARDDADARTSLVDLDALLADVLASWSGHLPGRRLVVDGSGAPRPRASAAAVRQILNVLLDNAATHGVGTVTVTARDAGEALAVDVTDEGGVEADLDPFHHRTDGHGIGLALARSLAEAEGGRLVLASRHPTGFTLLLPADG